MLKEFKMTFGDEVPDVKKLCDSCSEKKYEL